MQSSLYDFMALVPIRGIFRVCDDFVGRNRREDQKLELAPGQRGVEPGPEGGLVPLPTGLSCRPGHGLDERRPIDQEAAAPLSGVAVLRATEVQGDESQHVQVEEEHLFALGKFGDLELFVGEVGAIAVHDPPFCG